MNDWLSQEIERMDQFFKSVSDEELLTILRDLDWEYHASIRMPILTPKYSVSVKPVVPSPITTWRVRYRSVINKTPTPTRLAA